MNYLDPALWTATTPPSANQLLVGGSPYWVQNAGQSWSLTNPGGDNTTLRFEVRPGDFWSGDEHIKNRTEIASTQVVANGTPIHVSYDWMVEPGPTNDASWMCVGQLRQTSNAGWSPPFSIDLVGEKMAINIDEAGNSANAWSAYHTIYTDAQNIVRGHTYQMQITAEFDPVNGYLLVVRDGVTLVNYHGPLGYLGMGSGVYWKEGVYRAAAHTTQAMDYSHLSVRSGTSPVSGSGAASSPASL